MTVREALLEGGKKLASASGSSSLDASILLAFTLRISKEKLLASYQDELSYEAYAEYQNALDERLHGKPIAYITGIKEFYGRNFKIDARVLIPRPETELLVEEALGFLRKRALKVKPEDFLRIHDTCTGSGAIPITINLEWKLNFHLHKKELLVEASDISLDALSNAKENAEELCAHIHFIESDLFSKAEGFFDLLSANPPYIPSSICNDIEKRNEGEPRLALDGGLEGLEPYKKLIPEAFIRLKDGGMLIVETGFDQKESVSDLFTQAGFTDIHCIEDYAGLQRIVKGIKP